MDHSHLRARGPLPASLPGDIPKEKVFEVDMTCWEAHPGLCRTEAANRLPTVALSGKRLCKAGYDKEMKEGDFLAVKVYGGVL